MADSRPTPGELLVLICLECGKEFMFEDEAPPADLSCDKCGNAVFRPFAVSPGRDDVEDEFRASTERDLTPEEGPGDVTPGDVSDLGRI